jgi:type IV fimbrial biogenesis protein FimT
MNKRVLLLLPLTVSVALFTVAAPRLVAMLEAVQVSSAADDFMSDFRLAQSEASWRNSHVVLCKSADGASCAARGDWSQGWIVFDDANRNGMRETGEPVIVRERRFSASLYVGGTLNRVRAVTFAPQGQPRFDGSAVAGGTFTVCHRSLAVGESREIRLAADGLLQAQRQVLERCA